MPQQFRTVSLSLGATRWQTIRHQVLPHALPGIITGVILGLGRAAGETAPILFTVAAFYLPDLPQSLFDQTMALPYHLYVISTQVPGMPLPMQYGTALVLLLFVLSLTLAASLVRSICASGGSGSAGSSGDRPAANQPSALRRDRIVAADHLGAQSLLHLRRRRRGAAQHHPGRFRRNELFVLFGPSRAARSTLLRLFNRLSDLLEGTRAPGRGAARRRRHLCARRPTSPTCAAASAWSLPCRRRCPARSTTT